MIEISLDNGDTAEADTPEEAVYAAKTIGREARRAQRMLGYDPKITFRVDGEIVRRVGLRDLCRL